MASNPLLTDALVIGAGWSGLMASLKLAQAGKRVIVLEARTRIGGRAFTHSWDDGTALDDNSRTTSIEDDTRKHTVDFGCSWIHGYNEGNPIRELAQRYGVKVHVPKPTPSQIIGSDGPVTTDLAAKLQANLRAAQSAARLQACATPAAAGLNAKNGMEDSANRSLASFLLAPSSPLFSNLKSSEEKQMAISLARSMHIPLGTSLEHAALTWTGFEDDFAGTDGAPEGGFTRLIDLVAKELQSLGVEIKTGLVVEQIINSSHGQKQQIGVEIAARNEEGKGEVLVYRAKSAIVTIPLAVLKETHKSLFSPELSVRKRDVIDRINVGNLNKVGGHQSLIAFKRRAHLCSFRSSSRIKCPGGRLGPVPSSYSPPTAAAPRLTRSPRHPLTYFHERLLLCLPCAHHTEFQGKRTASSS